jgi:hypothetical protein
MGVYFNACMSENDSLNELKKQQESYLTDLIRSNNNMCEIMNV